MVGMAFSVSPCAVVHRHPRPHHHHPHRHKVVIVAEQTNREHNMDCKTSEDATSQRFIDTFCQFQRDIWALGPRPKQPDDTMTDEDTEQALKNRFTHSQKILDLRRKYYAIYSEFLTQKQIRRMYELERQMMERLSKRGKSRRTR